MDEEVPPLIEAVHDHSTVRVFQVVLDDDFSLCEHGHTSVFQHPLPHGPSRQWVYDAQSSFR
jgi:hypothetical protein